MMRKIESSEEIERKEKRRNKILTFFMLGILVLSTLGFAFFYNSSGTEDSGQNNDANSNGRPRVEQNGDRWSTRFGEQVLIFSTSPDIAKNISANFSLTLSDFQSSPLYLFIKNDGIKAEIGSTLGLYTQRVQEACYGKCEDNLPEKNCSSNLIVWKESGENRVYQEEKCIFIEGDIRAADAFLYGVFGII